MRLYLINTIALKSIQEGYSQIKTRASNVYEIAVFSDDNEAMVESVKLGKELLPYSEGWGSHEKLHSGD